MIDRSKWGPGPWDSEVKDVDEWDDKATGYRCIISRHLRNGHWCGYVRVPDNSPTYNLRYRHHVLGGVLVHGGLTYSSKGLIHISTVSTDKFFGFDCAHYDDAAPNDRDPFPGSTYKNLSYIKIECGLLALQLHAINYALTPKPEENVDD